MYVPPLFGETRTDVLHQMIREHPLAALVTLGSDGLDANHLPFELDAEPAPLGTLRAHVARGNPVWRDFSQAVESLVVFQGPAAYITPSWYQTKRETGKVVPTYNYIVVHAHGPVRIVEDPGWLRGLVGRLTNRFEAARAEPWKITDAPADFLEKQLQAIVGIEIPITKLVGKWKVSQNRPPVDRDGVVRGLRESGDANAIAMAKAVEQSGKP
ncbi:MAG TPA: FMN-binding negative transcriptional regulator [Candidatus Acidoferrum sp.]|nr:FMN-binding negative transcriptional regulator [Candidatus Acidoferrum sp.]